MGSALGNVAAAALSPLMIASPQFGWRGCFYAWGIVGYVWLGFWLAFAVDDFQTDHRGVGGASTVVQPSQSQIIRRYLAHVFIPRSTYQARIIYSALNKRICI